MDKYITSVCTASQIMDKPSGEKWVYYRGLDLSGEHEGGSAIPALYYDMYKKGIVSLRQRQLPDMAKVNGYNCHFYEYEAVRV